MLEISVLIRNCKAKNKGNYFKMLYFTYYCICAFSKVYVSHGGDGLTIMELLYLLICHTNKWINEIVETQVSHYYKWKLQIIQGKCQINRLESEASVCTNVQFNIDTNDRQGKQYNYKWIQTNMLPTSVNKKTQKKWNSSISKHTQHPSLGF